MTLHLLDSDGVVDHLRGFAPIIALIEQLFTDGHDLATCDIVLAEIYAGLLPRHVTMAEQLLGRLHFLPHLPRAARQAGMWRFQYARQGRQLSLTDCLIAAVAREQAAILVTRNVSDFAMMGADLLALPKPFRP